MLFHILVKFYLIKTIKSHQTDALGATMKKLSVKDKYFELTEIEKQLCLFLEHFWWLRF